MAATYIPGYGPLQDSIGAGLGRGFGQGMMQGRDAALLRQWLQNPAAGGGLGAMPTFLTPQMQQMGMQLQGQQLQNQMPMNPLQQAQAQYYQAKANEANQPQQPEPPSPSDLKAREMQGLDAALDRMERAGRTDTDAYKRLKRRRDEMYGYDVSGESPQQQLAQKKLDLLSQYTEDSYEFKKAMGIDVERPAPKKLHETLVDALGAIEQGSDPVKVYREMFRLQPEFRTHAVEIRRILLAGEDPFAAFLENLTK